MPGLSPGKAKLVNLACPPFLLLEVISHQNDTLRLSGFHYRWALLGIIGHRGFSLTSLIFHICHLLDWHLCFQRWTLPWPPLTSPDLLLGIAAALGGRHSPREARALQAAAHAARQGFGPSSGGWGRGEGGPSRKSVHPNKKPTPSMSPSNSVLSVGSFLIVLFWMSSRE